jgi:hypothetical protein
VAQSLMDSGKCPEGLPSARHSPGLRQGSLNGKVER